MSKPEFVYVIYIASTPEKVFQALTDEKMSEQYWVGNRVVSDWKVGAPFALKLKHKRRTSPAKCSNSTRPGGSSPRFVRRMRAWKPNRHRA